MKSTDPEIYTKDYLNSVIDVLMDLLREKGVTLQEIGDRIGVSRQAVGFRINHRKNK